MEERNRFIDPKRYGIWIAVAFGLALLALVTTIMGIHENRMGAVVTQVEVLNLNNRIVALEHAGAAPATAPAAHAAPAK
jgi:hypothetical protein